MNHTGHGRKDRPPGNSKGQAQTNTDFIDKPTGRHLAQGIGPKESTHDDAHRSRIQCQFSSNMRSCNRQIGTVNIVNGIGQEAETDNNPSHVFKV